MTDGIKTLYMTVLSEADRALMLGRSDGNGGNSMPAGRSNATGGVGNAGPFDLA